MIKKIFFLLAILFAMRAGSLALTPLFAQTYGQAYGYASTVSSCVNLTQDLGYGMSDSYAGDQVSQLQLFLIQKGYLGISAPTGYFGSLTQSSVRSFQSVNGLSVTGYVTAATRSVINQQSCAGTTYNPYGYGTGYAGQYYYPYNQGTYGYYAAPTITSLSANSGTVGSSLTIYGSGFDTANNTVYINGTVLSGQTSYNGTSITITVPAGNQTCSSSYGYYPYQTYCPYQDQSSPVYVVSSRGTSNTLSFTVTGNYYYGSSYPYNYNYNYSASVTPNIASITPATGSAGAVVTVYGSGFSYDNNTIIFGSYTLTNIPSYNGTSLTFTVPAQSQYYCTGYCDSTYQSASTVSVSVRNAQGYTSNIVSFSLYPNINYGNYYYGNYYNYGY